MKHMYVRYSIQCVITDLCRMFSNQIPVIFAMGCFGQILGWVVSALVVGSFRTWVVLGASRFSQSLYKLIRLTNIRAFIPMSLSV